MKSIYVLSWDYATFWPKLQLFFVSPCRELPKIFSFNKNKVADGLSNLSSTYCSIAGTAKAHWKPSWSVAFPLWFVTWLPIGGWCFLLSLPLSECVLALKTYAHMSVNQCDIRQSILRGWRMYGRALICIRAAIQKGFDKDCPHARGLIYAGLADVYVHQKDKNKLKQARDAMFEAVKFAEKVDAKDSGQASRIYQSCAMSAYAVGDRVNGDAWAQKSKALAEAAGAKDRLVKLASLV